MANLEQPSGFYESAHRPPNEKTSLEKNHQAAKKKLANRPIWIRQSASTNRPISHHTRTPPSIRIADRQKKRTAKRPIWICQSASTRPPIGHRTRKLRPITESLHSKNENDQSAYLIRQSASMSRPISHRTRESRSI